MKIEVGKYLITSDDTTLKELRDELIATRTWLDGLFKGE